ncbi:MAG: hypothetical protein IKG80_00830 [Clostridia bacterium]|nr:hypothetical protein [Clostridia bacterium]
MGRDKGFTKSKNPESKRYKKDMARHLDGMALKCVTERINGIEEVIGKSGAIILKGDEIVVWSGQEILVRVNIFDMKAWELMSLDGVVITFPDPKAEEGERTVVAYYSYYRKLED